MSHIIQKISVINITIGHSEDAVAFISTHAPRTIVSVRIGVSRSKLSDPIDLAVFYLPHVNVAIGPLKFPFRVGIACPLTCIKEEEEEEEEEEAEEEEEEGGLAPTLWGFSHGALGHVTRSRSIKIKHTYKDNTIMELHSPQPNPHVINKPTAVPLAIGIRQFTLSMLLVVLKHAFVPFAIGIHHFSFAVPLILHHITRVLIPVSPVNRPVSGHDVIFPGARIGVTVPPLVESISTLFVTHPLAYRDYEGYKEGDKERLAPGDPTT
jgi:hypothetical protein